MKTIYFDSYVYNRLIDEKRLRKEILKLKHNKKIEILFSDYLFNELACIFLSNHGKGYKIFECISKLISNRILKQRESLINEEIVAFVKEAAKPEICLPDTEACERITVINRLAKMEKPTNPDSLLDILVKKNENLEKMREIVQIYNGKKDFEQFQNFEEYYKTPDVGIAENDYIKELLETKVIRNSSSEIVQKVKNNRCKLPHFDAYLRMIAAYRFALFKKKENNPKGRIKKTDRGDDYDMRHFTSAATLDVLVCDREFLPLLKWVYPNKSCVILDNLLKTIKNT